MSFKKGLQKFYKSKMIIPLIFVFALLIGIAGYFKYSNVPVLGDAALFKSLGQEVLSGEWLTSDNFGYARTPGYPIILGTIYAIFRNNDIYVKFIQVIVYSIIPLVIIYIGSVLFNRMVGIVSALWYITYYEYVKFSYLIMREIWITLFILLILLFFILYIRRNRTRDIIIGSICFGSLIM
ncbi:glycosyltransferase family 39 protein, partial [candidate division WOR-3 bacterium]|nr:glycosyltransferase family 39 protein [candidate division WOR-3 bacterium]